MKTRSGSRWALPLAAPLLALPAMASAEEGPRPATVYIDYDGGWLEGGDDSALDQLGCIAGGVHYPAFLGSRALTEQVTEQVRAIFEPFAVRVVDERPPEHLPYTKVMVGGLPQALGLDTGVGGYACVIDCGDAIDRETVLVFGDAVREPRELAQTVVHEVGHSWGLDHVLASELIMNPTTSGAERMLGDGCTALDDPAHAECLDRHAAFCDEPGTQDAVAELLAVRGPSEPDLSPPRVELRSPGDGERFVPGELVRVEVVVEDDRPAFGWRLVVPELGWSQRGMDAVVELRFPVGEHTVRVEAIDQAGNETAVEVALVVGDVDEGEAPEPGDDASGASGSESGDEVSAGDDDDDDAHGGCRIGSTASPLGSFLLSLLLVAARRRMPR